MLVPPLIALQVQQSLWNVQQQQLLPQKIKGTNLTSQVMSGFKSAPGCPRTATEIKNKGVYNIPAWIFQPKGDTCVAQGKSAMMSMGKATCERPGPAPAATSNRGRCDAGGQETRKSGFPKRGEGARVLQTSTIYHSQSSVLLAGDRCSSKASSHRNARKMGSLDTWLENSTLVKSNSIPTELQQVLIAIGDTRNQGTQRKPCPFPLCSLKWLKDS